MRYLPAHLYAGSSGPFAQLSTSLINVGSRKLERVPDQFQLRLIAAIRHQHFHHVEPEKNIRVVEQPQPGQAALRDPPLLAPADRRHWSPEIFASACFDLHKHQRVAVAADDIDFAAAASAEIAIQNFVAVSSQKTAGQFFAPRAAPDMVRLGGRGKTRKSASPLVEESAHDGIGLRLSLLQWGIGFQPIKQPAVLAGSGAGASPGIRS
jgi:hypothetical protein